MMASDPKPTPQTPRFEKGERLFNFRYKEGCEVVRTARQSGHRVLVMRNGKLEYRPKHEFDPAFVLPPRGAATKRPAPEARAGMESEPHENRLLQHVVKDTPAEPRLPTHEEITSEKIKHYVINFIDSQGQFHVERIAATGIVSAISIFYMWKPGTAVVSVICIL